MAGSMNRLHDLLPRIIEDLDEEYPVGVLGLDNWGYITMGPDRDPDSMPSDGWGLALPEYYYYMPSTLPHANDAGEQHHVADNER